MRTLRAGNIEYIPVAETPDFFVAVDDAACGIIRFVVRWKRGGAPFDYGGPFYVSGRIDGRRPYWFFGNNIESARAIAMRGLYRAQGQVDKTQSAMATLTAFIELEQELGG
jgi:hypothetical protein